MYNTAQEKKKEIYYQTSNEEARMLAATRFNVLSHCILFKHWKFNTYIYAKL